MDKHHWKNFKRVPFEDQTVELRVEKGEKESFSSLLVAKKSEPQQKKKVEKKTATTVHMELKKILSENPGPGEYLRARELLLKAKKEGFNGRRLDSWDKKIKSYFTNKGVTKKRGKKKVGSTLKNINEKAKKQSEKNKEKEVLQKKESSVNKKPLSDKRDKEKEKEFMVDLPDLPLDELEEAAEVEQKDESVQDESGGAVVFGILGAGQAGGRLAESFYKLGYKKTLVVNTAEHDLNGLGDIPESQKVCMTSESGGGAGKDMRLGEAAADKHQQEIYEKMQKMFGPVDRVLVCVGSGGGTGGGSCLRLVETAKKYLTYLGVSDANKKVGVLVTLPTAGEAASPTVANNSHLLVDKLCTLADQGMVSPLIIFDNDKIKKMYPKLTVRQFWPTVNNTVTGLFHMFNALASQPSDLTSFDPADYSRVLSAGGCMVMGMTSLKEYSDGTDISKAVRGNLEKGLLCGGFDVSTAKAASCIATVPGKVLDNTPGLMDSLETGFDTLANITGNATVFRGIYESNKDKFVVYTMLTGLSGPDKRLQELKKFQENKVEKQKLY